MQDAINKVLNVQHGFKPIEHEAKKIFLTCSVQECLKVSSDLLQSESYQIRCLGVFLLGYISSANKQALGMLKIKVGKDDSWQVQEILAKSFDQYCNDIGYEMALPIIEEWLDDTNPNVCRAVTEGLRIWTGRPYFKEHPEVAIQLISRHKASESEYLRKSVGNSLRDISKMHFQLVDKEISTWNLCDKKIFYTYKFVTKGRRDADAKNQK